MSIIRIGDIDQIMRPTHGAMERLEERLETSLSRIYHAHLQHALKLTELAVIVFEGLYAETQNEKLSEDWTVELVYKTKTTNELFRQQIAEYLLEMLYYPDELKKKMSEDWGVEQDPPPPKSENST